MGGRGRDRQPGRSRNPLRVNQPKLGLGTAKGRGHLGGGPGRLRPPPRWPGPWGEVRVRVPCGSRREARGEVRETRGTSRLSRRDATGGVAPRAASDFTCHIWRVKSDAAGAVMGMCGASVPFPDISVRPSPAMRRPCDFSLQGHPCAIPGICLCASSPAGTPSLRQSPPKTSRPGRLGGGLSLPGSPPRRPGLPSPGRRGPDPRPSPAAGPGPVHDQPGSWITAKTPGSAFGSVTTAKRPAGMSTGPKRTSPPAAFTFSTAASVSATPK